jgi:hypothetical protein
MDIPRGVSPPIGRAEADVSLDAPAVGEDRGISVVIHRDPSSETPPPGTDWRRQCEHQVEI